MASEMRSLYCIADWMTSTSPSVR